jgi:hypothetical protein
MSSQPRILRVGEEPPPLPKGDPSGRDGALPTRPTRAPNGSSQGRFQSINAFLDVTMAELDRAELAVWLLLWRDTKSDGLARSSQADLARRAGCNARTVRRALAGLQRAGLVSVLRQGGLNRGLSVYRIAPLGRSSEPQ